MPVFSQMALDPSFKNWYTSISEAAKRLQSEHHRTRDS